MLVSQQQLQQRRTILSNPPSLTLKRSLVSAIKRTTAAAAKQNDDCLITNASLSHASSSTSSSSKAREKKNEKFPMQRRRGRSCRVRFSTTAAAAAAENSSNDTDREKGEDGRQRMIMAKRLGACAIVSCMVMFGQQKSCANAASSTNGAQNDQRASASSSLYDSSSSVGGVDRRRDDDFRGTIDSLKPPQMMMRSRANEVVGNIAGSKAKDDKNKTNNKKDDKNKTTKKKKKTGKAAVKLPREEKEKNFRSRFNNDIRKMPWTAMTDEEGAAARKLKIQENQKRREQWREEKAKMMAEYGSMENWAKKIREKNTAIAKNSPQLKLQAYMATKKAIRTINQMDAYFGEVEESASNFSKSRKKVIRKLLAEREKWLEQRKGWFGKILRSDASKRFVRTINLNYLKDPFASKGTDWNPTETSYTGFNKLVEVGRINKIVFGRNGVSAKYYVDGTDEVFFTYLPHDDRIAKKILQCRPYSRGEFIELSSPGAHPLWWTIGTGIFYGMCPLIIIAVCYQMLNEIYRADEAEDQFANIHVRQYKPSNLGIESRNTSLNDIAGIEGLKDEMYELIHSLRNFQTYKDLGAQVPGGILLAGPPGTGKTLLARCLAGEAGVPFFSVAATEFTDMFVGIGAARVRNLFQAARKVAPCIIFIDEFDAVGSKRAAQMGQEEGVDERVATINQFLTEMDGFEEKCGVMLVAATNRPQVLDPALIRPGRFDRVIEMNLPNKSARSDIIRMHISRRDAWTSCESDLDIDYISKLSSAFSGADLENMVKQCLAKAVGSKGGVATTDDFLKVINSIRATKSFAGNGAKDGTDNLMTRSKFKEDVAIQIMNPYVRDSICLYTSAQVLVAMVSPEFDDVANVVVFPGGKETSVVQYIKQELDTQSAMNVSTRTQLESHMCVLVAGQMAERYIYGPYGVSTMSHRDMVLATDLALDYVVKFGWSELGPIALLRKQIKEEEFLGLGENDHPEDYYEFNYDMSPELDMLVYNEVRKLIILATRRALCILHQPKNREMLFTLKEVLGSCGEINGRNLIEVFERAGIERTKNKDQMFKPWSIWDIEWGQDSELYYDEFIKDAMPEDSLAQHYEQIRQLMKKNMEDENYFKQTINPQIMEQLDKVDPRQYEHWNLEQQRSKTNPQYDDELVQKLVQGEIEWLSSNDPKTVRAQKMALRKLRAEILGFADVPKTDTWQTGEMSG